MRKSNLMFVAEFYIIKEGKKKNEIMYRLYVGFSNGCVVLCFLTKMPQGLKIHHIKVIETDESKVIMYHKSSSNNICVELICLCFVDVIFTHLTGFDGVQHTLGKTQQQGIE